MKKIRETTVYNCYTVGDNWDNIKLEDIFYLFDNNLILSFRLENGLEIRQWQDIIASVETRNWSVSMHHGDIYLTDGRNVVDKFNERWEEELIDWIEKCEQLNVEGLSEALKKM